MKFRDPSNPLWSEALKMLERAEQLHKHFFQLDKPAASGPVWEPPIDVLETGSQFLISIALPGVAPSTVKIIVSDNSLHIIGERPVIISRDMVVRRLEIPYGRFEKRIDLPAGNYTLSKSDLKNGCLLIVMNKLG